MEGTFWTLVPSIVTVIIILITKELLGGLAVGIILGALIKNNWGIGGAITSILTNALGVAKEQWYLFTFVIFIGIMTALIRSLGGNEAFSAWAQKYIKTRWGAQLLSMLLGFVFYFDDTCSVFLRARIVAPLTDSFKISRSKLALLIHSTAAPIIMLIPFSAIGAVVLATLGKTLAASGFTQISPMGAFITSLMTNYYVVTVIIMVFVVTYFRIDIGQMRTDEVRAIKEGIVFDPNQKSTSAVEESKLPKRDDGVVSDLLAPVSLLLLGIICYGIYATSLKVEGAMTFKAFIANLDVTTALVVGGVLGAAYTVIKMIIKKAPTSWIINGSISGIKTTGISIVILFMALLTTEILKSLKIGVFLSTLFGPSMSIAWLPVIIFITAGCMSYGTGTTLGTVTLLIPVGLELCSIVDPSFFLAVVGAVFSGALFGEHQSPLSDTSILSAAGSGITTFDHLGTQWPYARNSVGLAVVGFIIWGFTKSTAISMVIVLALEAVLLYYLYKKYGDAAQSKNEAAM